ncbi:MAG: 1-phosphofructokinase family hexose kinase [Clostridium sp.]|nr:1-phosphofructokinase family hexose kinase [Clostridium sp.]
MIYTVTFNPSLDYIVAVDQFELGKTNRTSSEQLLPGGKGVNVSAVLHSLGVENTALGFLAGFTGREIEARIRQSGISCGFIFLEKGCSRINIKMKDFDGTEINGAGPDIDETSLNRLMGQLNCLERGDTLVLAGSIPASMPKDIYSRILDMLKERGVELGEIFHAVLNSREEVVPYARKLQEMGAQNVLVSMAGQGAVLLDAEGCVHMLPAPKGTLVNAVGAGDSMVAGFLAGWMESQDYSHAFKMGISAGSASAFSEFLATEQEIRCVYQTLNSTSDLWNKND